MMIRPYRPEDCGALAALFRDTIDAVNGADYTEEQRNAWAAGAADLQGWNRSLLKHDALVAVEGDRIVGFGDITRTGYLDRLYVHRAFQGQGIGTALCDRLEGRVTGGIVTHASITARPFFEQRGYRVIREQQVERRGVLLTNFVMEKAAAGRRAAPRGGSLQKNT